MSKFWGLFILDHVINYIAYIAYAAMEIVPPLTWVVVMVCVNVAWSVVHMYRKVTGATTLPSSWTSGIIIAASLTLGILSTCASTGACGQIDAMRCQVVSSQYDTGASDCPPRMVPPPSVGVFLSNFYDIVNVTLMSTELWVSSTMPSFAKLRVDAV